MSAKTLAACSFEPAAERTAATGQRAPDGLAAKIQFREDLWREYRREAINAGFSAARAAAYANTLSPEVRLVAGVSSETAPVGRGWFYQSQVRVVKRTIRSGVIEVTLWKKSEATGRTESPGAPKFAFGARPWNAGKNS